jgi:hypothetical protein
MLEQVDFKLLPELIPLLDPSSMYMYYKLNKKRAPIIQNHVTEL